MAMATLTLASAALAATLSRLRTTASRLVSASTVALSLVLIQTPSLAALVHVEPLHLDDWAIAVGGAAAAVSLLGIPRLLQRRRPPKSGSRRVLATAGSAILLAGLCTAVPAPGAEPPPPDVERLLARLDDLYRSKSSIAPRDVTKT
jgi:drug/metabolite transporter (DMT)-like permease